MRFLVLAGLLTIFLVFGAEKHDAAVGSYPSYSGLLDEIRFSEVVRYTGNSFSVPTAAFTVDADTAALYHFDEGSGTVALDAVGLNNGDVRVGGNPVGPVWKSDTPFSPEDTGPDDPDPNNPNDDPTDEEESGSASASGIAWSSLFGLIVLLGRRALRL